LLAAGNSARRFCTGPTIHARFSLVRQVAVRCSPLQLALARGQAGTVSCIHGVAYFHQALLDHG
jgi:hypothetical protein